MQFGYDPSHKTVKKRKKRKKYNIANYSTVAYLIATCLSIVSGTVSQLEQIQYKSSAYKVPIRSRIFFYSLNCTILLFKHNYSFQYIFWYAVCLWFNSIKFDILYLGVSTDISPDCYTKCVISISLPHRGCLWAEPGWFLSSCDALNIHTHLETHLGELPQKKKQAIPAELAIYTEASFSLCLRCCLLCQPLFQAERMLHSDLGFCGRQSSLMS